MIKTGIHTRYQGNFGEIRQSNFFSLQKDFEGKPSLSFKYVLSGQEAYVVDGKHFEVSKGNALFFKDDKKYQGIVDTQQVTSGLCIDLNFENITGTTDILQEKELFLFAPEFKTQRIAFLHENFHHILQQIGTNTHSDFLFLEESMCDLLHGILSMEAEFQSKMIQIPVQKQSHKKELFQRLLIAKNFIHDNMKQTLQLTDIAEASSLSVFYMHRLFRQVFGCSPTVYVEKIRMQSAKEKLQKGLSVKEVAFAVGYTDEGYFSRRFKKCFGSTPKHFTKK